MSHVVCYILNPPLPLVFWGQKNVTYNSLPPPAPPIVYCKLQFPCPPSKTKVKGVGIARAAKLADVACRQSSRQEPVGMRMHWHSTEICLFHLVIVKYADINQVDESCDDVTKLPNQAILGCPHEPSLQRLHSEVTMMYPHSCFIRLLRFHHPRDNPQHPATGIRLGMVPRIFPPWPLRLGSHLRFVLLRCRPRCWEGTNCT